MTKECKHKKLKTKGDFFKGEYICMKCGKSCGGYVFDDKEFKLKEITTNVSEDFKIGLKMGYKKAQEELKKEILDCVHIYWSYGYLRLQKEIEEIFSKEEKVIIFKMEKEKGDLK